MVHDTWETVISRYENVYIDTREPENARGILDLLFIIKDDSRFADLRPGSSHMALILRSSEDGSKIVIWCRKYEQEYRISLEDHWGNEKKVTVVNKEELISTLAQYVGSIRSE